MLGLARAAQSAGWSARGLRLTSSSVTDIVASTSWADRISIYNNNEYYSPSFGDNLTSTFDQTGMVSGNRVTNISTFRFNVMSSLVFDQDVLGPGYDYLKVVSNAVTQHAPFFAYTSDGQNVFYGSLASPKLGRTTGSNNLAFLVDFGTYEWVEMPVTWDSLANQWITVMISGSDNVNDFQDWDQPPGFGNFYFRVTVTDATTGVLLAKSDRQSNQFNPVITDQASRTWRYRSEAGDSATAWLQTQIRTGDQVGTNLATAAGWAVSGEMLDPLATVDGRPVYQYFVGQNFPETVAGVRAWINFSAGTTSTSGSDTLVPRLQPGRVSTVDQIWAKTTTAGLVTPATTTETP